MEKQKQIKLNKILRFSDLFVAMIPSVVSAKPTKMVKKFGMAQGSLCQKYSIADGWIESSGIGNMDSSISFQISPHKSSTYA